MRERDKKVQEFWGKTGQQQDYIIIEKKVVYVIVFCTPLIATITLAIVGHTIIM